MKVGGILAFIVEINRTTINKELYFRKCLYSIIKFKTLKDFISYSMSEEDQPFSEGGLVSLLRLNRS